MVSTKSPPGFRITEGNRFPNCVVPVATAVPAFVGYTPKAEYRGKSYLDKPTKITSLMEFQAFFMLDDPAAPADPARQYSPEYYLVAQKEKPAAGEYLPIDGQYHSILPDQNTIYHLYNSVRLFYQNGGDAAYIVSVGPYGPASGKPMADPAANVVNPNVRLEDLKRGLASLSAEQEPTMYVFPEATLLTPAENGTLMQSALMQAEEMGTVVCLFDIIGGASPDPVLYTTDIQNFRNSCGNAGLKYGVSYYPFIGTSVMQGADIDFTNLFGGDTKQLALLLNPPAAPNPAAAAIIAKIESPGVPAMSNSQLQAALLVASPLYRQIVTQVLNLANVLPPSGAIAGVYSVNDSGSGVWNAPANTGIGGATSLPIRLSDSEQENLNLDALSGKSVNAIRFFNGLGILIWGARTLDGNSQDWRYVAVRRTMIFIEQSVKLAARSYVFEPNNQNTWRAIGSMIGSFLTDLWKQGGLQGASAADAFTVSVGLGSTMTKDDLLNGYMNISVQVAVARPAEFLVISIRQQQQTRS
ncbi:phage tail sheath family protein [Massilia glaciei]|uniref:Phage tail sheath family protein n=2 Tax=Massilia glaciei TaxID=1524097 RepID=A0A2U2HMD9_9BURK|nr:phage tail sheath family protein [Massilia glaciei]